MDTGFYKRDNCRMCGSKNIENVLPLTPTALCDAYVRAKDINKRQKVYPLDLFLCHQCGYVHLPYVVAPNEIYLNYIYVTTSSMGLERHFKQYADEVLRRIKLKKGSLIVDLGSNDGTLLKFFKNKGMRILGVEPAYEIAKKATEDGIRTIAEFFNNKLSETIKNEHGLASVITINNLFANIDNLDELAEGVRQLLAPDGIFIIESSYLGDMIKNTVFDFIYHEHLSYLSVKPLSAFLDRFGMELVDVERVTTKGGSLRYYFQKKGSKRCVSPFVEEMINYEKNLGLDRPDIFKTFGRRIDAAKSQLNDLLTAIKREGKNIIGYGASATTTTLIYHFNLADFIDYIVDDNLAKQGTFSPGYHIAVYEPKVLFEQKPDYILVLAWRYYQPIMEKQKEFLNSGGHFIVPLPKVEVI